MPTAITKNPIVFDNNRQAQALFPPASATGHEIVAALEVKARQPVIVVIGGADSIDDKVSSKLIQLFGRGIARAAVGLNAVIIDGGTEAGVMKMMGQGVADRGFKSALIGVAPLALVNYPGSAGAGKTPLDPNHSHFVLVEGAQWGSETGVIFKLLAALSPKGPSVVLLAGGGAVTRDEVLQTVRQNLPLLVIEGSGGVADEIATAWKAKPELPDDPVMAEIIADGTIEFHPLSNSVQGGERLLIRLLGGDNVLLQAWARFADYDFNALLQQKRFQRMQMAIIAIGILATALALFKQVFAPQDLSGNFMTTWRGWWLFPTKDGSVGSSTWAVWLKSISSTWGGWWLIKYLLISLPIFLTILITAASRFKQGNKWLLLRGGAEAIKREIFRYRARAGDYKEVVKVAPAPPAAPGTTPPPPPPTPEQVLAQRVEDVTRHVMGTEVNTSSIIPYKDKLPPSMGGDEDADDGFTVLTPDRYVQVRLQNQLGYYRGKAVKLERQLKLVQWSIYIIGGGGTLLAAINQQVWIALTTALAAALTTYLSYQQTENSLTKYNQAATDLENVKSWWTALPAEDQGRQENLDTLVDHTEKILQSELDGWVQQMQNALAELRKGQEKAPENESTPASSGSAGNQTDQQKAAATAASGSTATVNPTANGAEPADATKPDATSESGSGSPTEADAADEDGAAVSTEPASAEQADDETNGDEEPPDNQPAD